ncbi:hypothetical protein FAGAP_5864 [Fusarium agapanthi]|uniref:Uncharacterized protein n=1 Tax=Fusarium agapanthi TaxID=1803897 RepID=A0A9P5BB31_9HYPO|nr:hypothetical protein FAGAP_5864 [Fusarium agapanthi]
MDHWHTMCQCPNSNVEAKHWTPCTCPYPSPPDESSSTHASPNSVSHHDHEPTVSSPAAFEHHQSASDPGQTVSFCYGACSNHYDGIHPETDYASPDLLIDFEPQDTQPGDHTPPPTSGQSSNTPSPLRTEDQGIRSAAEELEDLSLADRFLAESRLNNMKWKSIHKEHNAIWAAKSEGALRRRMSRIKDENPAIKALLEQKI